MTGLDCKDCRNCQHIWGFMCICHRNYEQVIDGQKYKVGVSQDTARSHARVCEFYERREAEK